ncbi:MAG: hypothetical protein CMC75_06130 [Flavobacteriaceae bacterium]|nr:hypothetical protein [Flavobacteriaceae bacterium]
MCTVTFIPQHNNNFILTSNRDEAPDRATRPPATYTMANTQLLFPKDEVAGGTWIAISEKKRLICLLNGGFTPHERADSYRMSRGIIVTDFLTHPDIDEAIATYDFHGIEPFTMIIVRYEGNTQLLELVWDGTERHLTEKPLQPHIWSSSLLYSQKTKGDREQWFSEFLFENIRPKADEILNFHQTAGTGDKATDLIMDRGFVKTTSVTQVQKSDERLKMDYRALPANTKTSVTL